MHGLFGVFKLFTEVGFLVDEFIFLFGPVLLGQSQSVPETGKLFGLFRSSRIKIFIPGGKFFEFGGSSCVLLLEFRLLLFEFVDAGPCLGEFFCIGFESFAQLRADGVDLAKQGLVLLLGIFSGFLRLGQFVLDGFEFFGVLGL